MDSYKVVRRFFHKGQMQQVGEEIKLNPADANRYMFHGYIEGPLPKPRKVVKKEGKEYARFTN